MSKDFRGAGISSFGLCFEGDDFKKVVKKVHPARENAGHAYEFALTLLVGSFDP